MRREEESWMVVDVREGSSEGWIDGVSVVRKDCLRLKDEVRRSKVNEGRRCMNEEEVLVWCRGVNVEMRIVGKRRVKIESRLCSRRVRMVELGEVEDLDWVVLRRNDSLEVRWDRRRR